MRRACLLLTLLACGCRFDASGAAIELVPADGATVEPERDSALLDTAVVDGDDAEREDSTVDVVDVPAPTDWSEKDWLHRRRLVVDGSLLDDDVSDFVVPVVLSDPDMISKVALDGRDLRFTNIDGAPLAFELARWDSAGGLLVAWVKVPKLGPTLPNDFFLYYGNGAASSSADASKTWSGEVAVWHFDEATTNGGTTAKLVDATGGGHDGAQNGSESAAGLILGAQRFDGKDAVEIAKPNEIVLGDADCTVVAWFRTNEGRQQGILIKAKGETHETGDKLIGTGHEGPFFGVDHGWVGFSRTPTRIDDGKWHHLAWVQNKDAKDKAESWRLYLDGAEKSSANMETRPDVAGHTVRIGAKASGSYFDNPWTGDLDEVRYSKVVRGPTWIAALERSQRSPTTFTKVGAEETVK